MSSYVPISLCLLLVWQLNFGIFQDLMHPRVRKEHSLGKIALKFKNCYYTYL